MPSTKTVMAVTFAAAASPAAAFMAPSTGMPQSGAVALRGTAETRGAAASSAYSILTVPATAIAVATTVQSVRASQRSRRDARRVARNFFSPPQAGGGFKKEEQIGAQAPLGFWDPLDLCKDEATFKDFRAKELKHGRLAMMGALGMLTQSLVQLPGFEGVPKDVSAATVGNGQAGFILILAIIGALEARVFIQDESKEPGNFGNPVPWFDDYSDEMRARELNNGRIAMFAAIGQIAAGLYTGLSGIEQLGL